MRKRAKPGRLLLSYQPSQEDFMIDFPANADGHMLWGFVKHCRDVGGKTFLEELEARGYDTKTLRIQCDRRPA